MAIRIKKYRGDCESVNQFCCSQSERVSRRSHVVITMWCEIFEGLVWGKMEEEEEFALLKPVSIFLDFVERVQTGAKRLNTKPACSHRANVITSSVFTLSGQRAKLCWARNYQAKTNTYSKLIETESACPHRWSAVCGAFWRVITFSVKTWNERANWTELRDHQLTPLGHVTFPRSSVH